MVQQLQGTIAKLLAADLNLPVLHTGNIYRAIAYKIYQAHQDPNDQDNAVAIAKQLKIEDLEAAELNLEQVGQYASIIGSYKELRDVTYQFQRNFIDNSNGAVIEGRDIGTVICPEASFKFYITADVQVRAKRRFADQASGNYETILNDLKERDERDTNRSVAPLKPAIDAITIDSSKLNAEETLEKILYLVGNGTGLSLKVLK